MPLKPKKTIQIAKGSSRGMGFLPWAHFEQKLKETGVLTEQQDLKTIYLNDDGIYFTTKKATNDRKK